MPAKADLQHYGALFSVGLGATVLLVAGIILSVGFERGGAGWIGCGLVGLVPGVLLVLSGVRARNRAVAAGSTAHLDRAGGDVHTSRTEAKKPSFLEEDRREPGPE